MATMGISKNCSVHGAFNFAEQRDKHMLVGHVTTFSVGDTDLEPDLELEDPVEEAKKKVVGVISSFNWAGGTTDPITIYMQASAINKNTIVNLLNLSLKKMDIEITFNIYQYDQDKEVENYFLCVHTNDEAISGVLQIVGEQRQLFYSDEPGTEVQMPLNYQVMVGFVPEDKAQAIQIAINQNQKWAKQFGIQKN